MQLLQRLLDSFSIITKMYVAVTDVNGCTILSSNKKDTDFCQLIKSTPKAWNAATVPMLEQEKKLKNGMNLISLNAMPV